MRDVDDYEPARADAVRGAPGQHRRDAAQRGADQHRRAPELIDDRHAVRAVGRERVVAVQRPLAVAMAAQIEGDGTPAVAGERLRGAAPRVTRLSAPVLL